MKKIVLLLSAIAVLISCNTRPQQKGFTLTGTLKNIPDSTTVFLSKDNIKLDSTEVIGEQFKFTGKAEEPYNVWLMLPATRDYTTVWLENSDIVLTAEKGKFHERLVTGSRVQKEDELLDARLSPFRQAFDSAQTALAGRELTTPQRDSVRSFFDDLRKKEFEATREFIRENPNMVVSSYILNFYKTTWGKEVTEELYAVLPEARRNSSDGRMINRFLELNKSPRVGEAFADFEMKNASGAPVRLSKMRGKYTLLHFWAAHCYPSQLTNPGLVENYERFRDQGFEILGVSIDGDPKVFSGSIEEHGLSWTNVMAAEGKDNDAALIYGIAGTPNNFLIDENGIIVARDLRGEKLTQKLQELIAASEAAAKP